MLGADCQAISATPKARHARCQTDRRLITDIKKLLERSPEVSNASFDDTDSSTICSIRSTPSAGSDGSMVGEHVITPARVSNLLQRAELFNVVMVSEFGYVDQAAQTSANTSSGETFGISTHTVHLLTNVGVRGGGVKMIECIA